MPESTKEHEHTLNVWLGEELKKRGLPVHSEVGRSGRRLDVEVRIGPAIIAVEAEHGQSSTKKASAIRDANARLTQELAQCSIALCYPDNTTQDSLSSAQLLWDVRDNPNKHPEWSPGNLDELASVLRLAPMQLGNPDALAASLSLALDASMVRLSKAQKQALAHSLDLPASKQTGTDRWDHAAKRALLVLATAIMLHARLDSHLGALRPQYDSRFGGQPFRGDWPPSTAQTCRLSNDPVQFFVEAWNLILALDYKPIFIPALAALKQCPLDPALTHALTTTARAALELVGNIAGLRHDLLGRVFHKVLDTARYDGSFYTSAAAATLLATLAIREDMCDWQDPKAIGKLRITDPACGTGTLLMAAAERIRDLAPLAWEDGALAQSVIEHVLTGYDVNISAIHMTATTLGLLSPSTLFKNMKINHALLGVNYAGKARLGSLEILDNQLQLISLPHENVSVSQVDTGEEAPPAEPADLVIMNPPFTRDSLRHDQFKQGEEKKLKAREKRLFAKKPNHLSANSGAFLILADYLRKANSGVIAAVLPLTSMTDKSGLATRKFLAGRYHIDTVVSSHDPERIFFSENTNIGEVLLLCRHWPSAKGPKPATRVVKLAVNPATPTEALAVASAIENEMVVAQQYGTVQYWPVEKVAIGDWSAVQFLSPYLCLKASELNDGKLFRCRPLGAVADIGPAGQYVRGTFDKQTMPSQDEMVALWFHNTNLTQSMSPGCDVRVVAKPDKEKQAKRLWSQRGRLMLPARMRLNTVRVLSVRLDNAALGSAWVPCKPNVGADIESLEKALCAYFNSTIGALALLSNRSIKIPSYPRLSIDDMHNIVVPDFAAIGETASTQLAAAYDVHASKTLLSLPMIDSCPVRRTLDEAVTNALNLDPETVATIRAQIAAEPSVTGKRYNPNPLPLDVRNTELKAASPLP